jgi:hypothetical protein
VLVSQNSSNPTKKTSAVKTVTLNSANKFSHSNQAQYSVTTIKGDTCLDKKFSLVFYLIQDSSIFLGPNTPTPAITPANIASVIQAFVTPIVNALNAKFSRICVSFENCSTVVIPNWNYNDWDGAIETDALNNWYTENTINLYLPRGDISSICQAGYAYHPDAVPLNSRKRNMVVATGTGSDLFHAFGHFFGLPHTFAETGTTTASPVPPNSVIVTREFVDGSNCSTHGDKFCDTEADPNVPGFVVAPNGHNRYHIFCGYEGTEVDGKGDYYTPPFENYMSFWSQCSCRYSQEQYNHMAKTILTKRMYLH